MQGNSGKYIDEPISLANVIKNVKAWFQYILSSWLKIGIGTVIIATLFFLYQTFKKTAYTASTTFVLETESGSGLGQFSSLASLAGVNLGSLTESSSLFQIDNIVELYKSYGMLRKTLLTEVENEEGEKQRLITWYGVNAKYVKKWENRGISFELPDVQLMVRHDSVMKEVVEDILDLNLSVAKPSRKLSILRVAYEDNDEFFAKTFNETLVKHVNAFYLTVKTKKTGENLRVLTFQRDSVKRVFDDSLLALAKFEEENPNLNPLRAQAMVPMQKLQVDVQASGAVYQEIVKNLEIAKVTHRNNSPLIQVIDEPILPLEDDKMKWYKAIVLGLILGGVLMVAFFSAKMIFNIALKEL